MKVTHVSLSAEVFQWGFNTEVFHLNWEQASNLSHLFKIIVSLHLSSKQHSTADSKINAKHTQTLRFTFKLIPYLQIENLYMEVDYISFMFE